MTDIFGMGTSFKIKGRKTGNYYEGLLFEKDAARSAHFTGRNFLIDVKTSSGNEVTDFFSAEMFNGDDIPVENLKGDKYLVIDGPPRFSEVTTLEDLQGKLTS